MRRVLLFTAVLLFGCAAHAEAQKSSVNKRVRIATKSKKDRNFDQSSLMPEQNSFGAIASYSINYNQLEQEKEKTVNHRLSLAGTYSFDRKWSAYSAIAVSQQTQEGKIYRQNDSDRFHQLSNFNLGLVYRSIKPFSYTRVSSTTVNIGLPVSEASRIDQQVANFTLTNFTLSNSWKRLALFNRFSVDFLWNELRYSFANNDLINRDWLVSNSFGLICQIYKSLNIRASFRANQIHYLNGVSNLSFGSNISLFANIWNMQVFLNYVNNSYPESERLDIGYFDKYRQVYTAGVTYVF